MVRHARRARPRHTAAATQRKPRAAESELCLTLFQQHPDALLLIDHRQCVANANAAAGALLGLPVARCLGQPWATLLHLERPLQRHWQGNPVQRCLHDGHAEALSDLRLRRRHDQQALPVSGEVRRVQEGGRHFVLLRLRALHVAAPALAPATDAPEHDLLVQHLSRLNAVSELATGIAHELNQPLSAIMSYNQAAIRLLSDPDADRDAVAMALAESVNQTQRAADILSRLRRFVRRQALTLAPIAVNQSIVNALTLLSSQLRNEQVAVQLATEPCPPVRADAVQLEQVLVNLIRNAVEAMRAQPAGERRLQLRSQVIGNTVTIAVTDSGPGLPPDAADKLFTRFFTTKPDGMGLGLSICRHIIEATGGELSADNAAGGGACFRIQLPVQGATP